MKVNFPSIPSGNARRAAGILLLCSLIPGEALACACGCSIFDVGSTSLLPKEGDHGGVVYFEWDHSDQNQNWSGTSKAPAANNGDKQHFDRMVRRGHELHDQPRLGRWGADTDRKPGLHDRYQLRATMTTPDVRDISRLGCGRHRADGHVHRPLEGHVEGPYLRREIADRQLHHPRISTGIPKSAPAAPISFSAASGGA